MLPERVTRLLDTQEKEASNDYSDLRAVYFNGTLKPSPQRSHTDGLIEVSANILRALEVNVTVIRTVDHTIPPGVQPDMRDHGWDVDDFPALYRDHVASSDILVLGSPTWLGDQSSPTRRVIERLYGHSSETNDRGQYVYYGKVAGSIVTGNEDGAKHIGAQLLYALQHIGFTIPPLADAYWNGEAGPGPSFLDEGSGGQQNIWTLRNTAFMTWNLAHMARMLRDNDGIPAHGNVASEWETE